MIFSALAIPKAVMAASACISIITLVSGAAFFITDYQRGIYSRAEQKWDAKVDTARAELLKQEQSVISQLEPRNKALQGEIWRLQKALQELPPPSGKYCPPGCIIPLHQDDTRGSL